MKKRIYTKQALTFKDQIALLKNRGLTIADEAKAEAYLQEISYYRLSAYFLPYQKVKDQFNTTTNFEQIIATYSFDRELRLLLFDCIERIEVAIRTQFIYAMSTFYSNSHWQDDRSLFVAPFKNKVGKTIDPYTDFQNIISRAKTARRPEVFIKHYTSNYSSPKNPPSWMCLELLTMGELSHIYRGLKHNRDRKRIAAFFDLHPTVFSSWIHSITYVRNLCAHHSRLWNRDLAIEPEKLLKPVGPWLDLQFSNNKRVFYFISAMKYLLLRANPSNRLKDKLIALFKKYPTVPYQYLGIPSEASGKILNWEEQELWQ
jgi:abortive infection bacteriophage resistance protein